VQTAVDSNDLRYSLVRASKELGLEQTTASRA
jgi:hypothetical protein